MTRLPARCLLAAVLVLTASLPTAQAADFDRVFGDEKRVDRRAKGACSAAAGRSFAVAVGDDLRTVLKSWADSAGWTLHWKSDFSYQIAGNARFSGGFVDAVGALMAAMQEARPSPIADVYRANCVLVVKDGLSADR